ncbi:hypothetical protein KC19_VG090800 [Ceratodon purpureus]|uniref:Uncharacterized protein n=1 Tax=Ceratodon purpureus TaxID=3225 RepID=A0A8T0HNF4_CERPU|nr:hypothetical protein KC19_VG090800 [Ceratodon purpureus]
MPDHTREKDGVVQVETGLCDTVTEDQCHDATGEYMDTEMPFCELNKYLPPSPTLTEDVVAAMYVWPDAHVSVAELKEFSAEGKAVRRPFCFDSAIEERFTARARALETLETMYIVKH